MKVILLAAAALMIATPAVAQTAEVSGPRVEATVGWDRVVVDLDGESGGKSGVTYGGEVGYDFLVGPKFLLGAYAGVDGASTKDCDGDSDGYVCLKAGRNITAGARAGYMVGTASLIYVKGGYSNGRVGLKGVDATDPTFRIDDHANLRGFHVGAGTEVGLGHGLYGKVEYTYTNYEDIGDVAGVPIGTGIDTARHRVVVGAGFRF
jgi:outer membrane immunogenic protein